MASQSATQPSAAVSPAEAAQIESIASIFDPATLVRRGFCPLSNTKKPCSLYYELHGSASPLAPHIIFIMGLSNSCFAWLHQLPYFASKGYTVLVFDNRGVGHSDTPTGRYTTSGMAQDVIELLDHVGWTEKRSVHVVGVSLGGMIAMELALAAPERLASLILNSTKAGDKMELPSSQATKLFGSLLTGRAGTPEQMIALVIGSLFPPAWLDAQDPESEVEGTPRRPRIEREFMIRFRLNRPQSLVGRMGQTAAAMTHHVSASKLASIAKTISHIAIITGDEDYLINSQRSHELHAMLPGSEFKLVKGGGHALPSQISEEYNEWIAHVVHDARKAVGGGGADGEVPLVA